jgi:formylmethanofuran dehydrogenase subunit B
MPSSTARKAIGERAPSELYKDVICPFCGMLCDDLKVARDGDALKVKENGCTRAVAGFERRLPLTGPAVRGKQVSLDEAVQAAVGLLKKAALPLFGGLATDVDGMRAAMTLAERAGGIVDHALSDAQQTSVKVLETGGWITSTLTETRNRADLIIIAATDVHNLHPRFFERIVGPAHVMFDTTPKRTIVFIGKGLDASAATGPRIGEVVTMPCELADVAIAISLLRARLHGFEVPPPGIAGVSLADIDALAERCRKASYGVVVFAPASFPPGDAELVTNQIADLVKDLNKTTRFAGLPLGGNEALPTSGSVAIWQSGYPLRISFANGAPDYDPYRFSVARMLADGEGDLLVWIAAISPNLAPPKTKVPMVVLATPDTKLAQTAAVFIPIGTPGVDHAGQLIRVDNVVSLPLKDLSRAELPSAGAVLAAIQAAL